jgi:hypothetical protein
MKIIKLQCYFPAHTKINSKWIKDLYTKPEPLKLLEENMGGNLPDIGLGNQFLNITLKAQATKANHRQVGLREI